MGPILTYPLFIVYWRRSLFGLGYSGGSLLAVFREMLSVTFHATGVGAAVDLLLYFSALIREIRTGKPGVWCLPSVQTRSSDFFLLPVCLAECKILADLVFGYEVVLLPTRV